MKLTIQINKDQVYMTTDVEKSEGGFKMTLYRENGKDSVGFDGDESKREMCLKIADILLGDA